MMVWGPAGKDAAHGAHVVGDCVEGQGRGQHQAADEPATRVVVSP